MTQILIKDSVGNDDIEVRADWRLASCQIEYRPHGEDWRATPFQVADAGHNADRALRLVDAWADFQS